MKPVTNKTELKIGPILRTARVRNGKTTADIAKTIGVSDRMVRLWERDLRGIGRGKGIERTEEVFSAYGLYKQEREEVIRRVSLRKQEYVENSLSSLLEKAAGTTDKEGEQTEETRILVQLLALSPDKRKWVIQTANAYTALSNGK